MHVKSSSVYFPDVVDVLQFEQILFKFDQLVVLGTEEGSYGDSIVEVEPEGVERVVDDYHLTEIAIQDP